MLDVLFINPTEQAGLRHEVNGTLILGTKLLEAGFQVDVLRFGQIQDYNVDYPSFITHAVQEILARKPKCVSFYTLWTDYHIMLHIAQELKKRGDMKIVFGGPQSSATARAAMETAGYIDYLCTGEGEDTVVPFFKAILSDCKPEHVPGVYYRNDGQICFTGGELPLCDLNSLPYWDQRLYCAPENEDRTSKNYYMPIDAGRGCPYNCTFCCTSHFWRRTYRLKSPERIVQDIRYYKEKFGITSFWFSHDAFTINRKLVSEVCQRIVDEKLDIRWRCSARVDSITPELIADMKRAGMTEIELGVETGSARMQKLTNKNLDLNKLKDVIQFLLDSKLMVSLFFMYGFPEETEEDLNDTLKLMFDLTDMGVQRMNAAYCRFNPATAITEQYFDQLVFDPSVKVLFRKTFGYKEQEEFIRNNKALFPCYFHLHTKVRDEYQYVILLYYLYQQLPKGSKAARKLYNGDYLKLYKDFCEKNPEAFAGDADYAVDCLKADMVGFWRNMLKDSDAPCVPQLLAFMEYEQDLRKLKHGKGDDSISKTYDFNFLEYKLGLPIEQFTPGKTKMCLVRKDGKISQSVQAVK